MKIGIVGAGMIVKEFVNHLEDASNIEVVALYARRAKEEAVKQWAIEQGIDHLFDDYDTFLSGAYDAVYIAMPNHLHYSYAKKALEKGHNLIVEKPFTSNSQEAEELVALAKEKKCFLWEAITTLYLPAYQKIKDYLPKIGQIKILECNFSQYSSRYDRFKEGEILPVFNPAFSGGALMDINIYNIHYVVGLFGGPKSVTYYPNVEKGIDTSGILIMDYEGFKAVCIGAKDCKAPINNTIQGNLGCIRQNTPANICKNFAVMMNEEDMTMVNTTNVKHRMSYEFEAFAQMYAAKDYDQCYKQLEHTLLVMDILTKARLGAGIVFDADHNE